MSTEKDTLKKWSEKLTTLQKMLITAGAIIVSVFGGLQWIGEQIKAHDKHVLTENADIFASRVITILQKEGIATKSDIQAASDSINIRIEANALTDEMAHLRTLRLLDTTRIEIAESKTFEAELDLQIQNIQQTLDSIRGIATLTREEQDALAYTDSLLSVAIKHDMRDYYELRMRQSELEHYEALKEIRDLSRVEVIDKGRPKKVRNKAKKYEKRDWKFE